VNRRWCHVVECLSAVDIPFRYIDEVLPPMDIQSIASEISIIADCAAKIAVARGYATAEKVREVESALEQQLTARLHARRGQHLPTEQLGIG
jgi:hypothetical protein